MTPPRKTVSDYLEAARAQYNATQPHENRYFTPPQLEQLSALYQNRSWAVCQIREEKKGDSDWGTGFLIGGHFLITNFHVIPDLKTAQKSEAVFRRVIEQDVDGKYKHTDERRISLKDAEIFCSSPNNPKQEGDTTGF